MTGGRGGATAVGVSAARGVLGLRAMHHLIFAMKRSYHRALSKGRPLVEDLDLTPARFDMLFVLFSEHATANLTGFRQPATQKSIRQALGVSLETVSRMLESLEAKGFVRRGAGLRTSETAARGASSSPTWASPSSVAPRRSSIRADSSPIRSASGRTSCTARSGRPDD